MLFTTACVGLCARSPALMKLQAENFYLFWVALAIYLMCDLCMLCRRRLSRQVPINFIILLIATLCQGYMLSLTCATYTPECVFMVFVVATSTFVGMTLYSLCARRDVGVRGSILSGAVAGGVALGVVLTQFSESDIIYLAVCCLFVFIALTFVAVDTQMMLKERRYGISHEDYVVAALMLFVDFVNIFTHICSVVRRKKK